MWNLSKKAGRYRQAETIIVSIPKSGRTWLRVFLYAYFAFHHRQPFTISNREVWQRPYPKLMFTHDRWAHIASPKFMTRLTGRQLIPAKVRKQTPIVLLARDPRDVIVSLHRQLTRRDGWFDGSLSEMIRHPRLGIDIIIQVMNGWMSEWSDREQVLLVSYESCRAEPEKHLHRLLSFVTPDPIDETAFAEAMEFSSFDNMKKMEMANQVTSKSMRASDPNDPESFKVRKGVVGGYRNEMSGDDIAYINAAIARLDRRYGYKSE